MIGRARSWLYVPAHRPELLPKAMAGPADAVVVDLEDAVPVAAKQPARDNVRLALREQYPKPLWVRMNDPSGRWAEEDIAMLSGTAVAGVRVPKCSSPELIRDLADRLAAPLHLLLESALGVERAFELACCHPLIAAVSLGETDLAADLRIRNSAALGWARQRVVNANRAAGLPSPPASVWVGVADLDGLAADTERARDLGFFGRSVVHPSQIEPVNTVFTPSRTEVEEAQALLSAVPGEDDSGPAAWVDDRGRFIDPAVVAGARWLLERAAAVGLNNVVERHT